MVEVHSFYLSRQARTTFLSMLNFNTEHHLLDMASLNLEQKFEYKVSRLNWIHNFILHYLNGIALKENLFSLLFTNIIENFQRSILINIFEEI